MSLVAALRVGSGFLMCPSKQLVPCFNPVNSDEAIVLSIGILKVISSYVKIFCDSSHPLFVILSKFTDNDDQIGVNLEAM